MSPEDYEFIRALVKKRSGLVLNDDKMYLVESRLKPLASRHHLGDHIDLITYLRGNSDEDMLCEVTDAMTTNETFFFRDNKPFDILRNTVMPQILEKRAAKKSFRVWCCAASTGQEPYTLAMMFREMAGQLAGWDYEIIATDISMKALSRAKAGHYSQFEVQRGLPVQLLVKYFKNKGELWEIQPSLRSTIDFRELNLLDNFTALGEFDIVFCRNVLIYFDTQTKADILNRIRQQMPNDGSLFLGSSETVMNITDHFEIMAEQKGVYIPSSKAGERKAS